MARAHVVVIGAGVIGLQTAISLVEAGYDVTIIAKHVPGDTHIDYTSPWAGAIWRSNALPHEHKIQTWDRESYDRWLNTARAENAESPKSGILVRLPIVDRCGNEIVPSVLPVANLDRQILKRVPMRLLWTGSHAYIPDGPASIWYATSVDKFQVTASSSLPTPFTSGAQHDGIAVNAPVYLQFLAHKLRSLDVPIIKSCLPTDQGLAGVVAAAMEVLASNSNSNSNSNSTAPVSAFVNATGLAAGALVPDPDVYPIRGQTVVVEGEAANITTMFHPDANASVAPRLGSGTSILGSTYQEGSWDPRPDPDVTETIVSRCRGWAPELLDAEGNFVVVGVHVGFRPGRRGGPRVEIEKVEVRDGKGRLTSVVICHSYGHAGSGFQNSFGSAREVVDLVSKELYDAV